MIARIISLMAFIDLPGRVYQSNMGLVLQNIGCAISNLEISLTDVC